MDPNKNLDEQLDLARRLLAAYEEGRPVSEYNAVSLAELVVALYEWIRKGGALPERWKR